MTRAWSVDRDLDLSSIDPRATDGAPGDKESTKQLLPSIRDEIARYQRRLYAENRRSVLVVLQALDTGGKDGTIRHVFRGVNPMGVQVWSFGAPTELEARHDFLWRVHAKAPAAGYIGVFNRSHYEDVVAARVRGLVSAMVCRDRYPLINAFESQLNHGGTTILKFFLHISRQEQRERLLSRIHTPDKRWKFHMSDLDDRKLWDDYLEAYQQALQATNTRRAPWYVIPADRKWYRNWAVATTLLDTLKAMDPQFPDPGPFPELDVAD